jgi:flagella basal body P-ring formation protein FlgA
MTLLLFSLAATAACLPVDGDRIVAGDLAVRETVFAVLDPAEPLGYAPAPGARRIFSEAEVRRLAETHGLAPAGDSGAICFERAMEPLTAERIVKALRSSLGDSEAGLKLLDFSRQPVPHGELEFPRSGLGAPSSTPPGLTAVWRGRLNYGAGRSVPVSAKVRLWVVEARVVAATDLPALKPIRADQIAIQSREEFPFGAAPARSIGQVAGQAPRRLIRAGQPILPGFLTAAKEVERGETVAVRVSSGATQLKFKGHAESGGHTGEFILVRNPASGKTFRARIEGTGKVAVDSDTGEEDEKSTAAGASDGGGDDRRREEAKGAEDIAHR